MTIHKRFAHSLCACLWVFGATPVFSQSYAINTVAGTNRLMDGSQAVKAPLRDPVAVAVDSAGNLYIADALDSRIRKVSTSGVISTFAGTGIPGYSGDRGPANLAEINDPYGLAFDNNGNLYFADRGNYRVRRISSDGTINTIAGTGSAGFSGDSGSALSAQLRPSAVAVDSRGIVYVAEQANFRIRRIDTSGIITTIAGTGQQGYGGDNGPAANAIIGITAGMVTDSKSNLYFSDALNGYVRKIDTTGMISPFAGSGQTGFIDDNIPATQELMLPTGLAFDNAGNLYVADVNLNRIIRIDASSNATTVAGNQNTGYSGDGGLAVNAELNFPDGLAVDSSGGIYIADQFNNRVRKVAQGVITTVAGTSPGDGGPATAAFLSEPDGIAVGPSNVVAIADGANLEVRKFSAGGTITAVGQIKGSPAGVAFDAAGNLYASDNEPYVVKITPAGVTSIVAGNGMTGFKGDGGAATAASLNSPAGLAVDAGGNIYIADFNNERIRKVTASTGMISTVAGTGKIASSGDNGPAAAAGLDPIDLALDNKGNLFVADLANNRIRKIAPDGTITTVAGTGQAGYTGDGGPAVLATLNSPTGIAVDAAGNLYVADTFNFVIRRITAGGLISTIAGTGLAIPFTGDGGPALRANLSVDTLAVDSLGDVYFTDILNDRIRVLTPQIVSAASLSVVSGDKQSATSGSALAAPLIVKVSDSAGAPLSGVVVNFSVSPEAAATLSYPSAVTLVDGLASIQVTLGPATGAFTVSASVSGLPSASFSVTSLAPVSATAPRISSGGVVGAGLSTPVVSALSANGIATIFGLNFADPGTARQVGPNDLVNGKLPTMLASVCVLVGNQQAPVFSVYPNQLNFQVPNVAAGASTVQVMKKCGTAQQELSSLEPVTIQSATPEFFYFVHNADGHNPIAALNAVSGAFIGAPGLISGANFVTAHPDDIITLFATGFGPTSPSFGPGELPAAAGTITQPITVKIGDTTLDPKNILYAGVTQNAGLYQLNIQLPANLPGGELAVVVTIGGVSSPPGAFITASAATQ